MSSWWKEYGPEVARGFIGCGILLSAALALYTFWPQPKKEVKADE